MLHHWVFHMEYSFAVISLIFCFQHLYLAQWRAFCVCEGNALNNLIFPIFLQLILGTKVGSVRVFDIKEKKVMKEVTADTACPRFHMSWFSFLFVWGIISLLNQYVPLRSLRSSNNSEFRVTHFRSHLLWRSGLYFSHSQSPERASSHT